MEKKVSFDISKVGQLKNYHKLEGLELHGAKGIGKTALKMFVKLAERHLEFIFTDIKPFSNEQ
jgi:hypothetical protein